MGVDIEGKMLVGRYYEFFTEEMLEDISKNYNEDVHDWAEANSIQYASPWFDSSSKECFFGYEIFSTNINLVINEINLAESQWKNNFNNNPVVYAGQHVY